MSALTQNTEEWLEFRKKKIGASDAPILMGVSPWKTPHQLWLEKMDIAESTYDNSAMSRGRQLEPFALMMVMLKTGIDFNPEVVIHPEHDWMIASIDGLSRCKKYAVEIKCPGFVDHGKALKGEIPEKYVPQLQHQLAVLGLDELFYYSFDGTDGVLLSVKRDQDYIDELIKVEQEFYQCMVEFRAPEARDSNSVYRDDDVWKETAVQFIQAQSELKRWTEQEKKLRASLIEMSGQQNVVGAGLKLSKHVRAGNIDYSAIPELAGIDLEAYRKPASEYWKISIS